MAVTVNNAFKTRNEIRKEALYLNMKYYHIIASTIDTVAIVGLAGIALTTQSILSAAVISYAVVALLQKGYQIISNKIAEKNLLNKVAEYNKKYECFSAQKMVLKVVPIRLKNWDFGGYALSAGLLMNKGWF